MKHLPALTLTDQSTQTSLSKTNILGAHVYDKSEIGAHLISDMSAQPSLVDDATITAAISNLSVYRHHLETIHRHVRHGLEDSIRCLCPRAKYFHHVEEPNDLPQTVQLMMRKAATLTPSEFATCVTDVIRHAIWQVCKDLHQKESELFHSIESLHHFLEDPKNSIEGLRLQANQTNCITQDTLIFRDDLKDWMALTAEQEAVFYARDEPNLESFVQDSVDLAFRDDSRDILTLESATGFLQGVQKAATRTVFGEFSSKLGTKLDNAAVFWTENLQGISAKK